MHLHHLVHLTPNAILTLALFAHACEAFVGVRPSVTLLCHFFSLVRSASLSADAGAAHNTAPSAVSSLGGAAPASFPLPERTIGRTGSGNGYTWKGMTPLHAFVFLKACRRATLGGLSC